MPIQVVGQSHKIAAERIAKSERDESEAQKLYNRVTARAHLEEIVEKYPQTKAARMAKERLAKLDGVSGRN